MHDHATAHASADSAWIVFQILVLTALAVVAVAYAWGLSRARERSSWPLPRTVSFGVGLACVAAGLVGPLAEAGRHSFTAHMGGHLALGMLGPLLLVLGAPVTLGLRALPVPAAKRVTRVLRSRPVRIITHPVVAGVLNAGGLWVLYATQLFAHIHASVLVHAVVHAHIFLAGYVFTASIVGVDPDPHRASMRLRSGVLIAFIAAHSILGKWLYANPPVGVAADDARVGAQLMYYGGDAVDVTLIVLLFASWYAATRPRGLVPQTG